MVLRRQSWRTGQVKLALALLPANMYSYELQVAPEEQTVRLVGAPGGQAKTSECGDNQFRRQMVNLLHRHLLEASVAQAVCLVVSGVKDFVGVFHQQRMEKRMRIKSLCNKSTPILK